MITLKEYEKFVQDLISPASIVNFNAKLATAGLGLGGEAGEIAELVEAVMFDGLEFNDDTKNKLIKELGDLQFYITFASKFILGVSLDFVIKNNEQPKSCNLFKSGLTIASKANKISDTVKKLLFHGLEFTDEMGSKFLKQLRELQFSVVCTADQVCGKTLDDIIDENYKKLSDRYKTGKFSVQEFLEKERNKSE